MTKLGTKQNDVFESRDVRDTDPKQPNGLRRVRVQDFLIDMRHEDRAVAIVVNLTSGRRTRLRLNHLLSSKWKLVK